MVLDVPELVALTSGDHSYLNDIRFALLSWILTGDSTLLKPTKYLKSGYTVVLLTLYFLVKVIFWNCLFGTLTHTIFF